MADRTDDGADVGGADLSRLPTGDLNATYCATLVDEWVRGGLTDAVVCPGSRSTPMAVALAADRRVRVHVHHDERSGGFTALGLGRATGRPAVVLTTSGTATVELHPAVVEGHLDRVPILVVTADRPAELRGVGAAQTIDQGHLYGRAARWFADPGAPDPSTAGTWRSLAARALLETVGAPPGPVHLNLPFREPLVGSPAGLPRARGAGSPWHGTLGAPSLDERAVAAVVAALADARRGVIVAGAGIDDPGAVLALAEALGWPVLADPRSGCRIDHPASVAHADALLRVDGPWAGADAVLRLGSIPASKVQARWLAGLSGPQVLVEAHGTWLDPDRTASLVAAVPPGRLAAALAGAGLPAADRSWMAPWRAADDAAEAVLAAELDRPGVVTEPGTARAAARSVPSGGTLVVSSSMPVRDVEWFTGALPGVRVHSNRGANGIDGVVSTAVGVALAGAPTVLLIGDVALLHDTNGLLGAARRPVDLCVVVVDNDGGGIFSFLPQADALEVEPFERLFGTPHGVHLDLLAAAHDVPLERVGDAGAVAAAIGSALAAGGVRMVHVCTDRVANVELHERLHQLTGEAVRAAIRR